MSIIEQATKHYETQKKLVIDVPEWETKIYVSPMSVSELNMIQKITGKNSGNIEQTVNLIIVKAKDENGKRLFKAEDRDTLMNKVDYKVLSRIAEQIETHFFGNLEQSKGNSSATTSAETN